MPRRPSWNPAADNTQQHRRPRDLDWGDVLDDAQRMQDEHLDTLREALATQIAGVLVSGFGFERDYQTGGGCTAWLVFDKGTNAQVLLTDGDARSPFDDIESCEIVYLSYYDADGEWLEDDDLIVENGDTHEGRLAVAAALSAWMSKAAR